MHNNSNNNQISKPERPKGCPVDEFIRTLIVNTSQRRANWELLSATQEEAPVFYLAGPVRLYLRENTCTQEDMISYTLYTDGEGSDEFVISHEQSKLGFPNELEKLYQFAYRNVFSHEDNDSLIERLTAYTEESRFLQYGAYLGEHGPTSEARHISVKRLFVQCNLATVTELFLKMLRDEKRLERIPDTEAQRIRMIITNTVALIREAKTSEPSKRIFSMRSTSIHAKALDGSGRCTHFDSSLHEIANCLCSYPHELQPLFGVWIMREERTELENQKIQEAIDRSCVLLLRGILAQEV